MTYALKYQDTDEACSQAMAAQEIALARFQKNSKTCARSFLSLTDLTKQEAADLVKSALDIKAHPNDYAEVLKGWKIALLFQKTSTRTRCSFETGVFELGGYASYIDWRSSNFTLADLEDECKVLARYYDMIVARVNEHDTLSTMAKHSGVSVINGMCNKGHPCQVLSDFMTMSEYFGTDLGGLKIAYIGDGNNVCRSLVQGAAIFNAKIKLCSPKGYELENTSIKATCGAASYVMTPEEAVMDADIIYTDTWVSMGDEAQTKTRLDAFKNYQINKQLFTKAPKHTLFMHCLPAHPEQEVTAEILRSPRSVVFDQAENRLHAQKALMKMFAKLP